MKDKKQLDRLKKVIEPVTRRERIKKPKKILFSSKTTKFSALS